MKAMAEEQTVFCDDIPRFLCEKGSGFDERLKDSETDQGESLFHSGK